MAAAFEGISIGHVYRRDVQHGFREEYRRYVSSEVPAMGNGQGRGGERAALSMDICLVSSTLSTCVILCSYLLWSKCMRAHPPAPQPRVAWNLPVPQWQALQQDSRYAARQHHSFLGNRRREYISCSKQMVFLEGSRVSPRLIFAGQRPHCSTPVERL